MRLDQACAEFIGGYFSTHERRKKTKAAYQLDLSQFGRFAGTGSDLLSLDGTLVERWAAHLRQEDYSPASIRRKMVALRVFTSYWVRRGVLSESPFWRVKLSYGHIEQLPRSLTEREMRALLTRAWRNYAAIEPVVSLCEDLRSQARLPLSYRAHRNLAIVDLLFATGMRVGEISALDIQDFFMKEATFRVQGKGGRDRLAVIVDNATIRIQRSHVEARLRIKTKSPALFVNVDGGRLSTQGITKVIAGLRREARIRRHITPHMLRHTVATLLLSNGADIRIVQEFLGHKSILTTQRYTHITKDHMTRVLRKRHPSIKLNAKLVKLTA
ncbi:MAG TPA: tyrosine-type recombinase/integrase [Pyrinomonadaceae bacterium]|nr:tyrosine-type recombinase/integrase [Pyrinomonadaceae bacterium]